MTTAELTDWETIGWTDIPRDTWGRPLVIPLAGGKARAVTRFTTFSGAMEDTLNLGRWQQRMVALGLALRPDLLLRVSSLGEQPPKLVIGPDGVTFVVNPHYAVWRKEMDLVTEAALEAAKAHAKATVGTALHALMERMDNQQDTGVVPVDYLAHLGAYAEVTDGWEYLAIERFMVCDPLEAGGTPDRIARVPGLARPVIADIKTGDLTYGLGKIAIQLALAAHSVYYNHVTGEREDPPPDLDQELGLVIEVDATTGLAQVHQVDLVAGWEGAQLAAKVRGWRARRGLLKPWQKAAEGQAPLPVAEAPTARRDVETTGLDFLLQAVRSAQDTDQLTAIWKANRKVWTPELTAAASARKQELAG